MEQFEWRSGTEDGVPVWWRTERDTLTGRLRSVGVRAVNQYDCTPEVPRKARDPRLCPACEHDLAHTGAFHRKYAPHRPDSISRLLGRAAKDPLVASATED